MSDGSNSEVEKVLLFVSDARGRAQKAQSKLETEKADQHVIDALAEAERSLASVHRQLMQGTYFAVPERNEQLAV